MFTQPYFVLVYPIYVDTFGIQVLYSSSTPLQHFCGFTVELLSKKTYDFHSRRLHPTKKETFLLKYTNIDLWYKAPTDEGDNNCLNFVQDCIEEKMF